MFLYAQNFEGIGLENWQVSSVVDFSYMFGYAEQFNAPIGQWQTSSAQDMAAMFYGAISFDRDLNWPTSGVTDFTKFLVRRSQRHHAAFHLFHLLVQLQGNSTQLLNLFCSLSNKPTRLIVALTSIFPMLLPLLQCFATRSPSRKTFPPFTRRRLATFHFFLLARPLSMVTCLSIRPLL